MSRLSEQDWLEHGLKTLGNEGHARLKAEPLAKSLGVSRGSFYWHFDNLSEYHGRLLQHWHQTATDHIIQEVEKLAKKDRLEDLMLRSFVKHPYPQIDQAVRNWALYDKQAATHLEEVDRKRLAYLQCLFLDAGFNDKLAERRARFVYSAYLGSTQIASNAGNPLTKEDVSNLARHLLKA